MIDDMDRLKVRLREAEAGVDDHEITVLVTLVMARVRVRAV
jgi:hypothetical protein